MKNWNVKFWNSDVVDPVRLNLSPNPQEEEKICRQRKQHASKLDSRKSIYRLNMRNFGICGTVLPHLEIKQQIMFYMQPSITHNDDHLQKHCIAIGRKIEKIKNRHLEYCYAMNDNCYIIMLFIFFSVRNRLKGSIEKHQNSMKNKLSMYT